MATKQPLPASVSGPRHRRDAERWQQGRKCFDGYVFRGRRTKRSKVWVTAYAVTRHFGGREEGGWWYNWLEPLESRYVPAAFAYQHHDELRHKYRHEKYGNIYSVLGGQDLVVVIEPRLRDDATRHRPHYE
jgi:hypothetical protein